MAAPAPAPALLVLRRQLEREAAPRDGLAYWIMGDAAHARRRSAHNAGDALDAPTKLLGLYRLNQAVEALRREAIGGREPRLKLLIWARRSASARSGWNWVPYRGPDPHEWHAHIEIHHARRASKAPWTLW